MHLITLLTSLAVAQTPNNFMGDFAQKWCVKYNCAEDFCSQYEECKAKAPTTTTSESTTLSEAVVDKLSHGTVLIRVPDGEGSGFFIEDNVVLTNGHVLSGLKPGAQVTVVMDSGTRDGKQLTGIVMSVSSNPDLGLIWVDGISGRNLELASSSLRQTQPVFAVGFPLGSLRAVDGSTPDPTVSIRPGAVTGFQNDTAGKPMYIENNTNMQEGSSGGPLVDSKGAVVGINVAMLAADRTNKLAIPASVVMAWIQTQSLVKPAVEDPCAKKPSGGLGLSASPCVAQAAPPPPSIPTIETQIAVPFEKGIVAEVGIAPDGDTYFLLTDGSIVLLENEENWYDIKSGTNNQDITVDDRTGALFVVVAGSGNIMRYDNDAVKWDMVGDGANVQIAASEGKMWTIMRDGSVLHLDKKGKWVDLNLTGVDEVTACNGLAFLRAGNSLWIHDGSDLANKGKPVAENVASVACFQDRVYGLMADHTIVDFMTQQVIDDGTSNTAIFPTPTGLLAVTNDGKLWFFSAEKRSWSLVKSPAG